MIGVVLALLSPNSAAPPVPTGVNGSVLGGPEDFAVAGPATVCLQSIYFDLERGEKSYLKYSGIHNQTIVVDGPGGRLEIAEGDAWRRNRGKLVLSRPATKIYEVGDDRQVPYVLHMKTDYSDGEFSPVARIDGDVLRGNRGDRRYLMRLMERTETSPPCKITFNYGWDVLMDGEPFVEKQQ